MTRVFIDGTALEQTMKGVGKYALQLIRQLDKRLSPAWELDVLVFDRELPALELSSRVRMIATPACTDFIKGYRVIPRLLASTQADLLLSPMEALSAPLAIPRIAVCHDINELIWHAQRKPVWTLRHGYDLWMQRLRIAGLRRCRYLVCNSAFVQRETARRYGIAEQRMALGYCGVDEVFYRATPAAVHAAKEAGHGYILAFATGDVRENPQLLPESLRLVKSVVPDARLVVAGITPARPYVAALQEAFAAAGLREGADFELVPFLGDDRRGELALLYRNAGVYLELSSHEGFGMQLAEALASGVHCISTRGGALPEVGGEFADYLDELTPARLSASIIRSLQQPHSAQRLAQQIAFTRRYDWNRTGETVSALVERCCLSAETAA